MSLKGRYVLSTGLALVAAILQGCASLEQTRISAAYGKVRAESLRPIGNASALKDYQASHARLESALRTRSDRIRCERGETWVCKSLKNGQSQDDFTLDRIEVTGSRIRAEDVITNNQEAAIDEGDIVKKSGRHLFVLRRGWLHVVDIGTGARPMLEVVERLRAATDASGETVWYDEILAIGDHLILVGYNYGEDVVELLRFDVADDGKLARNGRYWLRVADYFSSGNYGSRIEGRNLLLSLTMPLDASDERAWPSWSRRDVAEPVWHPLVELDDVFLPAAVPLDPVIHLVLRCPVEGLDGDMLRCESAGVVGSNEAESYVAADAAYLAVVHWRPEALMDPRFDFRAWRWTEDSDLVGRRHTVVYRMSFDAEGPPVTAAGLEGIPGTQFSFKRKDASLYAVTEPAASVNGREAVLQRVEIADFSTTGTTEAQVIARLPLDPAHLVYRFTEESLWVGSHRAALAEESWETPSLPLRAPPPLIRQPLSGGPATPVALTHTADSIEPMGERVVASGYGPIGDWHMSVVDSTGRASPSLIVGDYLPAEDRSHAFNRSDWPDGSTLMGLPGRERQQAPEEADGDDNPNADILFFRWDGRELRRAGTVDMQSVQPAPACEDPFGCYDWYGNARLFFVGERIFALSGARLVEARLLGNEVTGLRSVELVQ
jgi:hypothetical protein